VVVVGQPGHVEVRGLVGDLDRYSVIAEASQAVAIEDGSRRIAVVCQTTTPPAVAEAAFAAVRERNPGKEIRFHDTICQPTRERQEALAELLERVEALVVVGGRRSNNTRALAKLAESRGLPCVQVERAEELDPEWFRAFAGAAVGLSAGTSTLPETVDAVERALEGIAAAMGSPLSAAAAAGI
jgi:4-hydroxy-3-methylbut-2-enyl diphosphate reductase